jgi:hypothetical protein
MHLTRKEAVAAEAFRLSRQGPSVAQQRATTSRLEKQFDIDSMKDPEFLLSRIEEQIQKNPSLAGAARELRAKYGI